MQAARLHRSIQPVQASRPHYGVSPMVDKIACPDRQNLEQFLLGKSAPPASEDLAAHLTECSQCATVVESLKLHDTLVEALHAQAKSPAAPPAPIVNSLMDKLAGLASDPARANAEAPTQGLQATPDSLTAASPDPISSEEDSLRNLLAAAVESDEIGRLGHYRILKVLGKGGMGVVFLGHDPHLDRQVAIKAMLPRFADNASAKQRFLREARAAAKLHGDHIVHIYQVSEERGVPYLAMEFLQGMPLDQFLKGGRRMRVPQILRVGREIARGLAMAHERGLIHRDIKPANVWLDSTAAGRAKILDFGLARATSGDQHLTQSGTILGTPAYMAPEQARGGKVDGRADLFSLGVLLYQLCTGELPFRGSDTISTLMAIAMNEPTPPNKINATLPPALSELVMRLLEKDANKRPDSAKEVIQTIQTIEKDQSSRFAHTETQSLPVAPLAKEIPARSVSEERPSPAFRASARPTMLIALAAACLLLAAAGVVFFWQTPDGVVRIVSNDPAIKLAFDDGELKIVGAYKEPLTLRPGKHGLKIKRDDFEFETDKLIVSKGDDIRLDIRFVEGKVQIVRGDNVIDESPTPTQASASLPIAWLSADKLGNETSVQAGTMEVRGKAGQAISVRILEIDNPPLASHEYRLRGRIRHDKVEGVGHLEMWNQFADGQAYFSKTLAEAGPLGKLQGTSDWRPVELPFMSKPGMLPTKIWVNVVLPRSGTVYLEPLSVSPVKAAGAKDVSLPEDKQLIQGRWQPIAGHGNGKPVTEAILKLISTMEISGDRISFTQDGKKHEGTFRLDPSKSPKEFDMVRDADQKNLPGIYSVSKEELRLCISEPGTPRPTTFTTVAGSRFSAIVLRREGLQPTITPLYSIPWSEGEIFTAADISANGRYATASRNSGTRVWDTQTGKQILELPYRVVRISADGSKLIASNGNEYFVVHVLDRASGKEISSFNTKAQIWTFSLSNAAPNVEIVRVLGPQGFQVWDWSAGKKIGELPPYDANTPILVMPDGRHALQWPGRKPSPVVLDVKTGKPVQGMYQQLKSVLPGMLSADGQRLVTGDGRGPIKVYDFASGKAFPDLEGEPTAAPLVSGDGRRLLADGKERNAVGLWDVDTGRYLATLRFPENVDANRDYRLSHDGSHAVIAAGSTVYLFRLPAAVAENRAAGQYAQDVILTEIQSFIGHKAPVSRVLFSATDESIWTASHDMKVRQWKRDGDVLKEFTGHNGWIWALAVSNDGRSMLAGGENATLKLWDVAANSSRFLPGHSNVVTGVQFFDNDTRAISTSWDMTVRLWDLQTQQCTKVLTGHSAPVWDVAVTPDNSRAVTCGADRTIRVWDLVKQEPLRTIHGHNGLISFVDVSRDGKRIVSGSEDGSVRVWNLDTGDQISIYEGHKQKVQGVAFSPDGRTIASSNYVGEVHLSEAASGVHIARFAGPKSFGSDIQFSRDGRFIVAGFHDGTARLLELRSDPPMAQYVLEFDGQSSHVEVPSLIVDGSHPVTIEAMVRVPNDDAAGSSIILGDNPVFSLQPMQKRWTFSVNALGGDRKTKGMVSASQPNSVRPGEWVHVAGVWDGKNPRIFINGVEGTGRADWPGLSYPKLGLRLGVREVQPISNAFQGQIDEIRISKSVRYSKNFTPTKRYTTDADTLALYHFDEGQGDKLTDSSGNGHHGKVVGAKWVKADGTENQQVAKISPFDSLRREDIPPAKLLAAGGDKLLPEVVAILGDSSPEADRFSSMMALHPDGKTLALASRTRDLIMFWDTATGVERIFAEKALGHDHDRLRFSHDGAFLAIGAKLWDVPSKTHFQTLPSLPNLASKVFFSPDDQRAFVWVPTYDAKRQDVLEAKNVKGRAPADRPEPPALEKLPSQMWAITFSRDGTLLVIDGKEKQDDSGSWVIGLWDPRTGKYLRSLGARHSYPNALALSPDCQRLFQARGYESKIFIHDVAADKALEPFRAHKSTVTDLAFSPDGKQVASCDEGGNVILWDPETLIPQRTLPLNPPSSGKVGGGVHEVVFTPDGRHLLARNADGTVYVVRLAGATGKSAKFTNADGAPKQLASMKTTPPVGNIAFSADGSNVIATGWNLTFFDALTGEVRHQESPEKIELKEKTLVTAMTIAADGKTLAYSGILGSSGFVRILDLPGRKKIANYGPKHVQLSLALSPDGKTLVYDDQGSLMFRDVLTAKTDVAIKAIKGYRYTALKYTPDGRYVSGVFSDDTTSGGKVSRLVIFDAKTRGQVAFKEQNGLGNWSDISSDSKFVVLGGVNGKQPVWRLFSLPDGNLVHVENLSELATCGTFSPDGSRLALGVGVGMVQIWETAGQKLLSSWKVADERDLKAFRTVDAIAFAPDGKTLATSRSNGAIQLWDLNANAQAIDRVPAVPKVQNTIQTKGVRTLTYAPDGALIHGGEDLTIYDPRSGAVLHQENLANSLVSVAALAKDAKTLAIAGSLFDPKIKGSFVRLIDMSRRQRLSDVPVKSIQPALALSPDGKTLVFSEGLFVPMFHDLVSGKTQAGTKPDRGGYLALNFSPDGKLLAGFNVDSLVLLDAATRAPVVRKNIGGISSWTAISADGKLIATGGGTTAKPALHVFDLPKGELVQREDLPASAMAAAFSPDSKLLAVGMQEGTLMLWDVQKKERAVSWRAHEPRGKAVSVLAVTFAPDGRTFATGGSDGEIKVWELTPGD